MCFGNLLHVAWPAALPGQVRRLRKLLDDRSFTWERSFRKLCWQRIKTACFNMFFAYVPSTLLKVNDMQRCSIFIRIIQSKSGGFSVVKWITGGQRGLLSWLSTGTGLLRTLFQKGVYESETYLVYMMLHWVQNFSMYGYIAQLYLTVVNHSIVLWCIIPIDIMYIQVLPYRTWHIHTSTVFIYTSPL